MLNEACAFWCFAKPDTRPAIGRLKDVGDVFLFLRLRWEPCLDLTARASMVYWYSLTKLLEQNVTMGWGSPS